MNSRHSLRLPGFVLAALTSILLVSCGNPEKDFRLAEQANTEQAFADFIRKHPKDPLADKARVALDSLLDNFDWEKVKSGQTVEGVDAYLKSHPTGKHASEATALRVVVAEVAAYQKVTQSGDPAGYLAFIRDHPDTPRLQIIVTEVRPYFLRSFQQAFSPDMEVTGAPDVKTFGGYHRLGQEKFSLGIDVQDHPELSGQIELDKAVKLGFCTVVNQIVGLNKLPAASLVVDKATGRIVAMK